MLQVSFKRVKPGKVDILREWMRELTQRRAEVVESFEQEGVREEKAWLMEDAQGYILAYAIEAEDLDRAREAYRNSTLAIDLEHRGVLRDVLGERVEPELLYDLAVDDRSDMTSEEQNINYTNDDTSLTVDQFLALADRVWPGDYDRQMTAEAIERTINIAAWDGARLIGCVRLLTDGYFFGCVTEILVDPDYQGRGIGRELMERAWETSPTGIFLGAQPGKEEFFEKLGYEPSLNAYQKRKPRPSSAESEV
jgi:GNAT superfamily N-acetyltransferase